MKRFLPVVLFLALACTTAAPPPAGPVHVVIVGTTDVHGWFGGHEENGVRYGGLAAFAGYVDALRASNPGRVVLVDSGDLFQGTLESNLFEGAPVVEGYNAIGYTAAAVGNHEFDYGPVGPASTARNAGEDPLGALKHNAAVAEWPFLSANMTEKATGKVPSWAKPYVIVDAGGAKIGIIGLSTPDTPAVTMEENVRTLSFGDPVAATVAAAGELRAHGADAVIVIAHMGGRCKVIDQDPHDAASCEVNQEAVHYLNALPKGTIDGYFAGHTHSTMRHYFNGIPAMQALAYSREFSTLDLWVDPKAHRVLPEKSELRPITMICTQVWSGTLTCDPRDAKNGKALVPRTFEGRTIEPDVRVTAVLKPYLDKVAAKRAEPTGIRTAGKFTRSYMHEATLGNLITDAMRTALHADFAFMNSGGIRADLRAGDLVYSDIFEMSPFDNYPSTVEMTGEQVEEALQRASTGERGVLQVSALKYTIDWKKDADKKMPERRRVVSVTLPDGSPLDRAKLYLVAMPDFLAAGGDGLAPVMKDIPDARKKLYLDQPPLRDLLIPVMRAMPQPLAPKLEGRITVLNDGGDTER
jgi:5'-nucleotidase